MSTNGSEQSASDVTRRSCEPWASVWAHLPPSAPLPRSRHPAGPSPRPSLRDLFGGLRGLRVVRAGAPVRAVIAALAW